MAKQYKKNAQGAFEWQDFSPPKHASNGGIKVTQPNQTTSIRELLAMHSRGMAVMGNGEEPIYKGEDTMGIDWRGLDLVDRQRITDEARETLARIKNDAVQKSREIRNQRVQELEKEAIVKAIAEHEKKKAEAQH